MPEPYCLAMVLCDGIHRDVATGKHTILGTFSTFAAGEFPAVLQFWVYFAITDGLGPTELQLRIVEASYGISNGKSENDGVIFYAKPLLSINFEDPLIVIEGTTYLCIPLPRPGLYHCELWANEDLLMSRRLLAIEGIQKSAAEGKS